MHAPCVHAYTRSGERGHCPRRGEKQLDVALALEFTVGKFGAAEIMASSRVLGRRGPGKEQYECPARAQRFLNGSPGRAGSFAISRWFREGDRCGWGVFSSGSLFGSLGCKMRVWRWGYTYDLFIWTLLSRAIWLEFR